MTIIIAMSGLTIRIAEKIDATAVRNFFGLHFNNLEPLHMSHAINKDKLSDLPPILIENRIESQQTLLAFEGDELVGVLMADKITPDEEASVLDREFCQKDLDICDLLRFVEKKADYFNRLKVPYYLHINMLSVHPAHMRKGIAGKLFEFSIANAELRDYPAITADCTSLFTQKIAEKQGLVLLSTVRMRNITRPLEKRSLNPTTPIQRFVHTRRYTRNKNSRDN